MKKYYLHITVWIGLLILAVILFSTCNPKKGYDFEATYTEDYNKVAKEYGDSSFYFYFAQAWLSEKVDEMDEKISVDSMMTLFQVGDTVITFYHGDSLRVDKQVGQWCECMPIDLDSVCIPLTTALEDLRGMEITKPSSNLVVLRRPLYPPFDTYPYYMFGSVFDFLSNNLIILSSLDGHLVELD